MAEPISIFDLRRKEKAVPLNGGEETINLRGLSAKEICDHLQRFPALASLSIGGTLTPMEALQGTPGALAAWIASACGFHNKPEAEAAVEAHLTAEDQANLTQESLLLTFSRGFGPFAARLGALMAHLTVTPSRVPGTKSPTPSPPAEGLPIEESGTSPPAS